METPSSSSSAGSAPFATVAPPTPSSHQVRRRHGARRSSSARPSFLWDLGRATLRGIRRCPRCGVYNGTRGLSCKNKACGATLRSATGAGRSGGRAGLELVRVVTEEEEGGATQVFSVCQRGRGGGVAASQWGFVELIATDNAISAINLLGHCFLPACRRGQRSIKSEAPSDSVCVHLKQAGEEGDGAVVATTLAIKSSALDALRASGVREELWRLAAATPGPLVQRVATNTLVVKCHADSQHPLGLLHLSVAPGGRSQGGERGGFHCPCQVGVRRSRGGGATGPAHPPNPVSSTPPPLPCLHVYAAVCAFNSDEKLTSEFSAFISNISSGEQFRSLADKPSLDLAVPHQKVKKPRLDASGGVQGLEEKSLSMSFHQWLAGVTERIHQTMHYQFTELLQRSAAAFLSGLQEEEAA